MTSKSRRLCRSTIHGLTSGQIKKGFLVSNWKWQILILMFSFFAGKIPIDCIEIKKMYFGWWRRIEKQLTYIWNYEKEINSRLKYHFGVTLRTVDEKMCMVIWFIIGSGKGLVRVRCQAISRGKWSGTLHFSYCLPNITCYVNASCMCVCVCMSCNTLWRMKYFTLSLNLNQSWHIIPMVEKHALVTIEPWCERFCFSKYIRTCLQNGGILLWTRFVRNI